LQDSYIELDLVGNFTFVNEATCRNLGYTMEELIGQNFSIIASGQDEVKTIFKAYNKVYKTGESHTGFAFKVKRKDGSIGYAETSISLIKNEQGKPIGFRSVGRDVTERKQFEQKLEEMATHDALTGLPNRTLLQDRFGIAVANAQRNKKKVAIMSLDLDLFKNVNDMLGHDMGDKLLIAAAGRLTGALRKSDTVVRMGGDEFVLLLWEVDHKDDAVIVAEKISEDFRQPFVINGHSLNVTISIGIATYPEDAEDLETLTKKSDAAMYYSKDHGRNQFKFFSDVDVRAVGDQKNDT
jgi:diguanylate cyclase (GGDEF)-like protein/PAS domain S-box-containing protein